MTSNSCDEDCVDSIRFECVYICVEHFRVRGALGTVSQLARNLGVLASYIAGTYFSYETVPYLFMGISVLFLVSFSSLPNTPQYFLSRNKFKVSQCRTSPRRKKNDSYVLNSKKAEKSLKFYKGCKGDSVEEIDAISREFDRMKLLEVERGQDKKLHWADLCKYSMNFTNISF